MIINEQEIHDICKKYRIRNYTINSDGSIDVDGNVNLEYNELTKIPIKFNKVSGWFKLSYNKLTSLENSPNEVGGHFYCSHNNLKNLIGLPSKIFGPVRCIKNPLESLEGFEIDYYKLTCSNKENLIKKHKRSKKLKLIESL